MMKTRFSQYAQQLCQQWQQTHAQLLRTDDYERKSRLLLNEHQLERAYYQLLTDYQYFWANNGK